MPSGTEKLTYPTTPDIDGWQPQRAITRAMRRCRRSSDPVDQWRKATDALVADTIRERVLDVANWAIWHYEYNPTDRMARAVQTAAEEVTEGFRAYDELLGAVLWEHGEERLMDALSDDAAARLARSLEAHVYNAALHAVVSTSGS